MEGKALILLLSLCSSVLPEEFRLVNGPSHCAGKLETRDQGSWIEVEDFELAWNRTSAAEVCRQLDCGSVVSMKRLDDDDNWANFEVEINCSETVRLVNGSSPCSGRLEVKSDQLNQPWISVNEDGFDQKDAEVVCRELDCGPLSVLRRELFEETEASVSRKFKCKGTEAALSDCLSSAWNYSGKAVGLTCLEPKDIKLVGGSSRCAGTLQMRLRGEWKQAYKQTWTLRFAGEVCKQVDCGSPLSVTRRASTSRVLWELRDCDGPSLTDCVKGIVRSEHYTEMTCSDSVRLVNGSNPCSGRLEVNLNESWSLVCKDGFSPQDAEVVCREIGCGPTSLVKRTPKGEPDAPILRKEVPSGGHESSVLNCARSWLGENSCPNGSNGVGLTCLDPDVRLVSGTSRCTGVLEIKQFGKWRPAGQGDGVRDWTLKQADVICQRLNCGSCVSRQIMLQSPKPSVTQIDFSCTQTLDCLESKYFEDIFRVTINCSDSVKLVNSSNPCSGRLKLKTNQSWSTVCEQDFDQQDAQVACSEIGCEPPVILQGALFGGEAAPLKGKEFQCEGSESALLDCRRSGSARHACSPENIVGLVCSDYLRLVGENSRCVGTVEMLYQGQWRPVADQFEQADNQLAASVCAELGCGTVVSAKTREEPSKRSVWWIESMCLRSSSELRHCVALNYRSHETSLQVTCSDLLVEPDISLFLYPGEVRAATNRKVDIPIGSAFGVKCSIKTQYQAGSFELVLRSSSLTQSLTLPAVNHSSLFMFPPADYTHQRTYTCIYHVYVFSHNFSSVSRPITLTISVDFIIRPFVVLMGVMLSVTVLYCYFKVCRAKKSRQETKRRLEDCSTKSYLKVETG